MFWKSFEVFLWTHSMGTKCCCLTAAKPLLHLAPRTLNYFKMLWWECVLVQCTAHGHQISSCVRARGCRQQVPLKGSTACPLQVQISSGLWVRGCDLRVMRPSTPAIVVMLCLMHSLGSLHYFCKHFLLSQTFRKALYVSSTPFLLCKHDFYMD